MKIIRKIFQTMNILKHYCVKMINDLLYLRNDEKNQFYELNFELYNNFLKLKISFVA